MDAVASSQAAASSGAASAVVPVVTQAIGGISTIKGINVALGILLAATSAAQQAVSQVTGKGTSVDSLI
ncbi:MAG: hypothetical protein AABZ64_10180 [Nitrospinota bacterium]